MSLFLLVRQVFLVPIPEVGPPGLCDHLRLFHSPGVDISVMAGQQDIRHLAA